MAGDTIITVVGNLTADPELRFTPSGAAVANFTVASTPRIYDRQSGEWKDADALFMRCNVWREAAENVAESLTRGARVIVAAALLFQLYVAAHVALLVAGTQAPLVYVVGGFRPPLGITLRADGISALMMVAILG